MRRKTISVLLAAAALTAACGGANDQPSVVGSSGHPLTGKPTAPTADGRSNEAAQSTDGAAGAGAGTAVAGAANTDRTSSSRTEPCGLVSRAEAQTILAVPVSKPQTAPQGPTCVYRTKAGKGFVTLAVQANDISSLKTQLGKAKKLNVADHAAYCGAAHQQLLYAEISHGWVLSVGAPCTVAKAFAARALAQLNG